VFTGDRGLVAKWLEGWESWIWGGWIEKLDWLGMLDDSVGWKGVYILGWSARCRRDNHFRGRASCGVTENLRWEKI